MTRSTRRRAAGGDALTERIAAVVPVIDEHVAIADVVRGLRAAGACCVFVVDGGSRDGTQAIATEAGALVVEEPRRGYGRACITGTERALAAQPDGHRHSAVAFLDGDGSCDPADLTTLLAAVPRADVVLGRRPGRLLEPGAMPIHARLGNGLVAAVLAGRSGRASAHDLPPYKVLRRTTLERLGLDDEGYGWTVQLVARALLEPSIRIREVPVAFRNRRGGTSKVSGSWRTSLRAGRTMLAVALRETRARPMVALMAKAPGAGHAKTRLAADLGEERTADLWIECLADVAAATHEAAQNNGAWSMVMLARAADVEPVGHIIGPEWMPLVQARDGLSAALSEVFLAAFDRGADRAVAVAGDVPTLPPSQIGAALAALDGDRRAAVVGPSGDGGYHLVGLRWGAAPRWWPGPLRRRRRARLARRLEVVFQGLELGGGSALVATVRGLGVARWRVTRVAPWPDIDTLADLQALARSLPDDGHWAPRTAAWVRRHRAAIDRVPAPSNPQLTHKDFKQEGRS